MQNPPAVISSRMVSREAFAGHLLDFGAVASLCPSGDGHVGTIVASQDHAHAVERSSVGLINDHCQTRVFAVKPLAAKYAGQIMCPDGCLRCAFHRDYISLFPAIAQLMYTLLELAQCLGRTTK